MWGFLSWSKKICHPAVPLPWSFYSYPFESENWTLDFLGRRAGGERLSFPLWCRSEYSDLGRPQCLAGCASVVRLACAAVQPRTRRCHSASRPPFSGGWKCRLPFVQDMILPTVWKLWFAFLFSISCGAWIWSSVYKPGNQFTGHFYPASFS